MTPTTISGLLVYANNMANTEEIFQMEVEERPTHTPRKPSVKPPKRYKGLADAMKRYCAQRSSTQAISKLATEFIITGPPKRVQMGFQDCKA